MKGVQQKVVDGVEDPNLVLKHSPRDRKLQRIKAHRKAWEQTVAF
jgi:hypothetical protein